MTDLRERLSELDRLDAPDMRVSIDRRVGELQSATRVSLVHSASPVWRGPLIALATAVAAILVVAASMLVLRTEQPDMVDEPAPTSPTTIEAPETSSPSANQAPPRSPAYYGAALIEWMYGVCDVAVAPDGLVYAAAPAGIGSMDAAGEWTLIDIAGLPQGRPLDNGWPAPRIGNVAIGPDGALWAGGTSWSTVDDEEFGGVIAEPLGSMAPAARFKTWAARYDCGREPCSWTVFTTDVAPGTDFDIGDMAVSSDGTVYLTTGDNLLLILDGTEWESHTVPGLPTGFGSGVSPWSSSLAIDADGVVWVGTNANDDPGWGIPSSDFREGRGLFAFDGTDFTRYTTEDGLPSDRAFQVSVDADGTIWVATDGPDHVNRIVGEYGFVWYEGPNTSLPPEAAAGIAGFDGTTWTPYTAADGLLSNNAVLAASPDGTMWALHSATTPYGYSHFDGTAWTAYPAELPAGAFRTFRAEVAPDGTLWTISDQGVGSFDGITPTIHTSLFPRP